jgi:hypothetical protein
MQCKPANAMDAKPAVQCKATSAVCRDISKVQLQGNAVGYRRLCELEDDVRVARGARVVVVRGCQPKLPRNKTSGALAPRRRKRKREKKEKEKEEEKEEKEKESRTTTRFGVPTLLQALGTRHLRNITDLVHHGHEAHYLKDNLEAVPSLE